MAGECGLRGHHGVHVRYAQRHYIRTLTRSSWLIETFTSGLHVFFAKVSQLQTSVQLINVYGCSKRRIDLH